jgi:Transposase DDE domain.
MKKFFVFVLKIAADKKLLKGKTVGVDSTTLEANAAMKSIECKDTGEDYQEYLRRLANDAGIEDPSDEDLRRFDKNRPTRRSATRNGNRRATGQPHRQDERWDDASGYKAEHVVDLGSDLVLSATITPANQSDAETLIDSVAQAQNLDAAGSEATIEEAVADKGYHKANTLELADDLDIRTYIPEPKRRYRYRWIDKSAGQQEAVYANRRRMRGDRGKKLQRQRSEQTERSFAHVCETGGARRTWLRGQEP